MLRLPFAFGFALVIPLAVAERTMAAEAQLVQGTVVSAGAGRLVLKDTAGKEQSFAVESDAKVTINGKPAKLEELKDMTPIHVMTDQKGKVLSVSTMDREKSRFVALVT